MPDLPMFSSMRPIIDALEIVLETWLKNIPTPVVNSVYVGYDSMAFQIDSRDFPYLCIDAKSERATEDAPEHMEKKAYNVRFELGTFVDDGHDSQKNSLRDITDRYNAMIKVVWTYRKLHDPDGVLLCDNIRPVTVDYDIMFDKDDNPQFRVVVAVIEFRTWQEANRRLCG